MSGVYVAKPAVTTDPDVPPGWNFSWTFPGPHPPGYEPEYTLTLEAPEWMVPGSEVSEVVATLYDHVTFTSTEPEAPLTWSAEWANPGETVKLKLAGGENYLDSMNQDYSEIGSYWGDEPTLEFNADETDLGKTILLKIASVPFTGYPVTASAEILLVDEQDCQDNCEEECEEECPEIEDSGCLADCDNAVASSPTTTYIGSFTVEDCVTSSTLIGTCGDPNAGGPAATAVTEAAIVTAGDAVDTMKEEWSLLWTEYCDAVGELETLECELEELECILECKEEHNCETEEIEDAIEDKEGEIAVQEVIRDYKLAAATAKSSEMDVQADLCMAMLDAAAPLDYLYLWSTALGDVEACTNIACSGLGPTCGGRDPLRCSPSWEIQSKGFYHIAGIGDYQYDWQKAVSGGYTISGKPYVTSMIGLSPLLGWACGGLRGWYCGDSYGPPYCENGCNGSYAVYELQLLQYFTEVTPGGETCC